MLEEPSTSVQKIRLKHSQKSSARSAKWMIHLSLLQWSPASQIPAFSQFDSLHVYIKKRLETLDTAKTTGPDTIPAIILKTCAPECAAPLAKLFQYSYNAGIYLAMWKISQVCLGHKKQDRSSPASYRPISLLSVIGKVMEDVKNSTIKQHLLNNNLLSDAQFGFCQ
eukprot:g43997.t1